jgi:hypothetical protein
MDHQPWRPSSSLPVMPHRTATIAPIHNETLSVIKKFGQEFPSNYKLASLIRKPNVILTTSKLRQLIAHGQPVDNEILVLFMDILCSLMNQGWHSTKCRFAIRR